MLEKIQELRQQNWYKRAIKYVTIKNIIGAIVIIVFVYFLGDIITADWMHKLIIWLGPFGPLGVTIYVVISHIFAPIAGSPGILLSVGLFGLWKTMFYAYLGGLISSTIAFWISKKWGRPLVRKFVGEETMEDIDEFVDASDEKLLIIARLFGFPMFDIVSYAAGLTPLNFRTYFLITIVCSAIPAFTVNYLVFNYADFTSRANSYIVVGLFFGLGLLFAVLLGYYVKRYKQFKLKKELEEESQP